MFCRHETFGEKRKGHADRERTTFGRVLFGPRTIIVTQQHQQVQSYSSRGTETTLATGMSKCQSPRWCFTKVNISTLTITTISTLFIIVGKKSNIGKRSFQIIRYTDFV